jgi:hypothetical protein
LCAAHILCEFYLFHTVSDTSEHIEVAWPFAKTKR